MFKYGTIAKPHSKIHFQNKKFTKQINRFGPSFKLNSLQAFAR